MAKSFNHNFNNKRDFLFLSLAGIFLTSRILGNVIGTTKFVTLFSMQLPDWLQSVVPDLVHNSGVYSMSIPVGVLAYPFTFLATDIISELFGRKKAQMVVWVGFGMNVFMLFLMWLANTLPVAAGVSGGLSLFEGVYEFMILNVIASMIAYLTAQTIDVQLFHFWKKLTRGRHKWLRNNGSTMVSQFVDSATIITILYVAGNLSDNINTVGAVIILILNSYIFKFFFALLDTPFFYLAIHIFKDFEDDPDAEQPEEPIETLLPA